MQINAQSAIKSPWLEIAKENSQSGSFVSNTKITAETDSVTLSPASMALASGKATEPEISTYAWPIWPTKPGGIRPE
jgi:hypothetical protein